MSLMLVGCAKEQTEDTGKASMELNPTELNFDAAASSKTVKVTCNRDWKVAEADVPEWVSLTVDGKDIKGVSQKASSNPVVAVTVLENTGYERACNIKFNGGTLATKTLTVKQAGNASYTTIAEVRALNPDKSAKVNAPEGTIVKGIVISNATLNNFNSKALVYVQDATAGICIKCSANHDFVFGDEVLVDLSGVSLEYYSNLFQANGVALDKISTLSSGKTPEVVQVSVADFLAGKYESRYVELNEDVQVVEADLSKNWVVGGNHTSIKMETKSGSNFIVQSSKYSSFKDTKVSQGSGKIKGIATVYNDQIQIAFAQLSDFAGLTGERFAIEVPKLETEKISEVIAAADNTEVTLKNVTVVAASVTKINDPNGKDTFMVEDTEHARLLVFEAPLGTIGEGAITVGDVVTVKGARTTYQGAAQLATPTVTKTGTGSVSYPSAKDISSEFDTSKPKVGEYVKFTGKLSISGNYYNVSVDGATKVKGSFNEPKFIDVTSFSDVPNVTYTGYYLYHTSKDQYLYIIVTEVKASDDPYLNVSPEKIDVNASATSAQFNVNSNIESWTCSVDNGASVNVTSGSKSQPVTVTFEANTDTENAKTYTVTVKGGDITKTVTITQSKNSVDKYVAIDKIADLTAGTYFMAGYLESYKNGATTIDFKPYSYHFWNGTITTGSNGDLSTMSYSFDSGVLTKNPNPTSDKMTGEAAEVTLVATGAANTYYVVCGGKYLVSTASATNRRLALQESPAEWVASNESDGGIVLTGNSVNIGTAGAESALIRSYKNATSLKYGLVFFKKQ